MSASFADGCLDSRKTTDYCPFFDRRLRIVTIQDPEFTGGSIVSTTRHGEMQKGDGKARMMKNNQHRPLSRTPSIKT